MALLVSLLAESPWIKRKSNIMAIVRFSKFLTPSKEKHLPGKEFCSDKTSFSNKKLFNGSSRMRQSYGMSARLMAFNSIIGQSISTNKSKEELPDYESEFLKDRTTIRVSGAEVGSFLQGLITNDINHLMEDDKKGIQLFIPSQNERNADVPPSHNSRNSLSLLQRSIYAMFLNTSGRVMFDVIIIHVTNDWFLIDCDSQIACKLVKHLKVYRVRRKIDISVEDNFQIWSLRSKKVVLPDNLSHRSMAEDFLKLGLGSDSIISIADPRVKSLGFRIIVQRQNSPSALRVVELDTGVQKGYKTLRHKLGVSEGPSELVPGKALPLECNADYLHGVSFHKGCYIGQELTARTQHTGIVRKRMMPFALISDNCENILQIGENFNNVVTGKSIGKLISHTGECGIGLMRVQECLDAEENEQPIVVGNEVKVNVIKPEWWPKISPKKYTNIMKGRPVLSNRKMNTETADSNPSALGDEPDIILYYYEHSSPSRKVLVALYEKGVEFVPVRIDLIAKEQHERWYLEKVNPRGEVPALKHAGRIVVESSRILEYIDQSFGGMSVGRMLYPVDDDLSTKTMHFMKLFDAIPTFPLTYGAVCFHTEQVTNVLRWPYCSDEVRNTFRKMILSISSSLKLRSIEVRDIPAGKILGQKANAFDAHIRPLLEDLNLYENFLYQIEATLDEVESHLSNEDRLGPWLCGPTFTAADISLSCLLLRLYQIGLDERMWKGAIRPNIAVYQEMAFKRPTLQKATEWNKHKNEFMNIEPSASSIGDSSSTQAAYFGMAAAVVLGAIYTFKKFRRT